MTSLRLIVLRATGQDVRQCCCCGLCSAALGDDETSSLEQWVQWLIANDERALTNLPRYDESMLREAQRVCTNRLDFPKVLAASRAEAVRRGLVKKA